MKKILALSLLSLSILSSCGYANEPVQTVTVVDMVGDTVTLNKNPQKVAVIARAAADMMIGFGLGDKIDGMYQSILDNPWTEVIYPDVSSFYSYEYNESAELFMSRGVDLVLAPEKYIADDLRQKGVQAITVSLYGNPRYSNVMTKIADLISEIWPDTMAKVNQWKDELSVALSTITNALSTTENNRSIYYVRGDKDRGIGYTDTVGCLVETIYEDYFKMTYLGSEFDTNRPSVEEIMLKNPDVIVVGGAFQSKIMEDIRTLEPQKHLSAVTNDQMYNIPIGFVMWEQNSMALPLFIYDQANKLYPDVFSYDIQSLTKTNFLTYFDYDLSSSEITHMLNGQGPTGA